MAAGLAQSRLPDLEPVATPVRDVWPTNRVKGQAVIASHPLSCGPERPGRERQRCRRSATQQVRYLLEHGHAAQRQKDNRQRHHQDRTDPHEVAERSLEHLGDDADFLFTLRTGL